MQVPLLFKTQETFDRSSKKSESAEIKFHTFISSERVHTEVQVTAQECQALTVLRFSHGHLL